MKAVNAHAQHAPKTLYAIRLAHGGWYSPFFGRQSAAAATKYWTRDEAEQFNRGRGEVVAVTLTPLRTHRRKDAPDKIKPANQHLRLVYSRD